MSYPWYEQVSPNTPLMQGDLLHECPIVRWDDPNPEGQLGHGLQDLLIAEAVDCVVMSQACDLEQGHIRNVILCPNLHDFGVQASLANRAEVSEAEPHREELGPFLG